MDIIGRVLDLLPLALPVGVWLAAAWAVMRLAERRLGRLGVAADQRERADVWLGLGAIVGARLPFVLARPSAYLAQPLDLVRLTMGLSLYGALAGALVVLAWLAWRRGLPFWPTADSYALALPLGIGLYRLGCLVRGDCYGRLAPPPFGVIFPGLTQPRFPAELYEAALALALFGWLWWLDRRQRRPGTLALSFLLVYSLARAIVDAARIDVGAGPLTMDQVVSLLVAGLAALAWLWGRRTTRGPGDTRSNHPSAVTAREREALP